MTIIEGIPSGVDLERLVCFATLVNENGGGFIGLKRKEEEVPIVLFRKSDSYFSTFQFSFTLIFGGDFLVSDKINMVGK